MNLTNLTTAAEIKKQLEMITNQSIPVSANATLPQELQNL